MDIRRNGELKKQREIIKTNLEESVPKLREASEDMFKALAHYLDFELGLESYSVTAWNTEYQSRKDEYPIVKAGKITLASEVEDAEKVLRDHNLWRWRFQIYEGASSQNGTDWRTGKYNALLMPDYQEPVFLKEFKKRFSEEFPDIEQGDIDYLLLKGQEPCTHQPLFMEFGKLPEIKYPLWHLPIRIAKSFTLKSIKRDLAVKDLFIR